MKRGNLLLYFCSCLEIQALACICTYINTNSGTCTQVYIKHVKCLSVFEMKEMGSLSNLENTSQKRGGWVIWVKCKKSLNKLVRKGKIESGRWKPECSRRETGTYVECGNGENE